LLDIIGFRPLNNCGSVQIIAPPNGGWPICEGIHNLEKMGYQTRKISRIRNLSINASPVFLRFDDDQSSGIQKGELARKFSGDYSEIVLIN
jgi:hypothetical protein